MNLEQILNQKEIKKIVVLTGAGISAESGIKTFRDSNGLWENHDITEVASMEGFLKDPGLVQRFYNLRRLQLKEVKPNLAHFALAQLEKDVHDFSLITQNVDDLHERAGSQNIYHMHGELKKIKHLLNGQVRSFTEALAEKDYKVWRPDIVWFGEQVKYSREIQQASVICDLFLCIGTSNNVYPAAGLVQSAKKNEAICIELNFEKTSLSDYYDISIQGKATEIVPKIVQVIKDNL